MPPRQPGTTQLDFPQLSADMIRELRLTGQLGLLDFDDSVQPVYIVAARGGALTTIVEPVAYAPAEIFSSQPSNPVINAILLDTGQLPAGTYDINAIICVTSNNLAGFNIALELQHRNAANAASLSVIPFRAVNIAGYTNTWTENFTYATVIDLNERLRWQITAAAWIGVMGFTLMVKRRITP